MKYDAAKAKKEMDEICRLMADAIAAHMAEADKKSSR